ncbi:hypothetical protein A2U01_0095062 [Trifolium medium]|uniref:Uncharacterized protein n=1 Tax=Trifolium medium TaxID=97028 RepID=A0A392ULN6_9FABA|nr:hypothetical protein [Trifolium medium]
MPLTAMLSLRLMPSRTARSKRLVKTAEALYCSAIAKVNGVPTSKCMEGRNTEGRLVMS